MPQRAIVNEKEAPEKSPKRRPAGARVTQTSWTFSPLSTRATCCVAQITEQYSLASVCKLQRQNLAVRLSVSTQ
eukprot:357723-Chlamydomonas_euryale.AAC.2